MRRSLSVFIFCFQQLLQAQSITPGVLAASGGTFSNTSFSIDYTIGELALVDTKQDPMVIITQGFHQPEHSAMFVDEVTGDSIFFFTWPNPASEFIQMQFFSGKRANISIRISDLYGRIIYEENKYVEAGYIERIYTAGFANGFYLLEVTMQEENTVYFRHLQKIQIIH